MSSWSSGRDECAVDQVVDLMSCFVALVLEVTQARVPASALQERLAQLGQRLAHQRALLPKQVEETVPSWQWYELHGILRFEAVLAGGFVRWSRPSPPDPSQALLIAIVSMISATDSQLVQGRFEQRVEILPFDDVGRSFVIGFEKPLQRGSRDGIAFVFQAVNFLEDPVDALEVFQLVDRLGQLQAGLRQALAELLGRVGDRFDLVQIDLVRGSSARSTTWSSPWRGAGSICTRSKRSPTRPSSSAVPGASRPGAGQAVDKLEDFKGIDGVLQEIHRLENEGDAITRAALQRLFETNHKTPADVIKWKDLYALLESTLDECESVAEIIETIAIKSA